MWQWFQPTTTTQETTDPESDTEEEQEEEGEDTTPADNGGGDESENDVQSDNENKTITPTKDRSTSSNRRPLRHPFRLLMLGHSGSGKTITLYNLLTKPHYYGTFFDRVYAWGRSVEIDEIWCAINDYYRKAHIYYRRYNRIDLELIEKLVNEIEENVKRGRRRRILWVFDDIAGETYKTRGGQTAIDEVINDIRHKEMSIIFSVQTLGMAAQSLIPQAEGTLMYPKCNLDERKELRPKFSPDISDDVRKETEAFFNLYKHATQKRHNFLFVNAQGHTKKYYRNFHQRLFLPSMLNNSTDQQEEQQEE